MNTFNKSSKVFVTSYEKNNPLIICGNIKNKNNSYSINNLLSTPEGQNFILWANRKYIIDKLMRNLTMPIIQDSNNFKEDTAIIGCLPSQVLKLSNSNENQFFIDPRRLTNWFIHIISKIASFEIIFPNKINENDKWTFYIRDSNVFLPKGGKTNIQEILSSALSTFNIESIMSEYENENSENEFLSVIHIFKLLIPKLQKLITPASTSRKRTHSGYNKIKISNEFNKLLDENNFSSTLEKWTEDSIKNIDRKISEYQSYILNCVANVNNKDTWAVKEFLSETIKQPNIPIYLNENISFPTMIHSIGEIFNILLLDILPKESMEAAINGSFFHMIYLKDINLLNSFKTFVFLPILYRLINVCYEDNSPIINESINYLEYKYKNIYQYLIEFQSKKPIWIHSNNTSLISWFNENCEDTIHFLYNVSLLCENLLDTENFTDVLYWAMNGIRKNGFEFYLVIILIMYKNSITIQNAKKGNLMNKQNKILNAKNIISPLFRIIVCFYDYIRSIPSELITMDILNSNNFGESPKYRSIIVTALQDFLKENKDLITMII